MRRVALVIAAGLGLTACSTQQMLAEHDDHACKAQGLEVGSVGYTDCRAALDKERMDRLAKAAQPIYSYSRGRPE